MSLEELERVIDDIRYGRIYSSTESVYAALRAVVELIKSCDSVAEVKARYPDFVRRLVKARPTSAMLANALREVSVALVSSIREGGLSTAIAAVERKVDELLAAFEKNNKLTAYIASRRLRDGDTILTVSYSRLVLETLRLAAEEGKKLSVYVTESRPGGEGLKLAAEMEALGYSVTLIVDSAARFVMKNVDRVLVGAEAVAANGALVNKVGTSLVALAAHEARVRVFALAPTHKISPETFLGELVELAEAAPESLARPPDEVAHKVRVWAPLFDVTPPEYIDAIITEKGLVAPQAVPLIVSETYGWPPRVKTLEEVLEELEVSEQ